MSHRASRLSRGDAVYRQSGGARGKPVGEPNSPQGSAAHAALFVGILGAYAALCAWTWSFTTDDAFISFRYAKHIGDGFGPIWNLADAEDPIEGYTAFFHVWLLGGIRWLTGADLVWVGKALGVASTFGLAVSIAREVWRRGLRPMAAFVALSFLLLPGTALNAVAGLETSLFALIYWLCVVSCLRILKDGTRGAAWTFAVYGFLGTLTRPEFGAA